MQKKTKLDLFVTLIFGGIVYVTSVTGLISLTLKNNATPLLIFVLMASKKITTFVSEVPFGLVADMKGARKLFWLIPFICLIELYYIGRNNLSSATLCLMSQGLVSSIISGKLITRIYNILQKEQEVDQFTKILSWYFITSDIIIGISSYFSGLLYQNLGDTGIYYVTIFKILTMICCLLLMKDQDIQRISKKQSVLLILSSSVKFLKQNKIVIILCLSLSFLNFWSWQFKSILRFILLESKLSLHSSMKFFGLTQIIMGLGSVVSLIYANRISIAKSIFLWMIILSGMIVCSLFKTKIAIQGNPYPIFLIPYLLFLLCYATIETTMLKKIEYIIPKGIRSTINSFGNAMNVLINSIVLFIIFFTVKMNNNHYSIGILTLPLLIVLAFTILQFGKIEKYLKS